MKKTTYECDICRDEVRSLDKVKKDFVGFEFGHKELVVKVYWDVTRHICINCLNLLGDLHYRYLQEEFVCEKTFREL